MTNTLFDALFERGAPDAIAIETADARLTYADLAGRVGQTCAALVGLGVTPGDRVAVQVHKSAANLILYLATLRAGAVYLPLNTAYTQVELEYFVNDAEPSLIVCDPQALKGVTAIAGHARVEDLDQNGEGSLTKRVAAASGDAPPAPRGASDLAAICYTSGTTGRSKGAMLTHGALLSNAATLRDLWRFTDRGVLIHALPIYHVHGLFVATNIVLLAGASMILQSKFDPGAVIAAFPRSSALMGVPTYYARLLGHPDLNRETASGIRLFVSGSAPLLPQTHRAWRERTDHAILERYGMTETGMNASNPYDGPRVPGAVGPPLPGVSVRVTGEADGGEVPGGSVGMVEVKGPNVFAGYWRDPTKTAAAFTDEGWFRTGDLGLIDEAGYLRLVGRSSDLIITGGLNVYPTEVEEAIDTVPGVAESAVIGLPHADFGEAVTAVVVATATGGLSEDDILAALAPRLARYKTPKRVLFASELPRNAMGKVVKAALRRAHASLYVSDSAKRSV